MEKELYILNTTFILKGANVTDADGSTVRNRTALWSVKPAVVVY